MCQFHNESFFINSLRNAHHDIVDEIYLKSLIYNKSNFDELKSCYVNQLRLMTDEELEGGLYGTYFQEDDITKDHFLS